MNCNICGTDKKTFFYVPSDMRLCFKCRNIIPPKASKEFFEKVFWKKDIDSVSILDRDKYWNSYKKSLKTLSQYIFDIKIVKIDND
jgi:hypothetical protein